MKYIYITILTATILFSSVKVSIAEAPNYSSGITPLSIQGLVTKMAYEKGVSQNLAHYVISHESHYDINAHGDKTIICERTGLPVNARGLGQITECWHPEITDEQAYDPIFALNWSLNMMKNKNDCIREFSTCRNYYNK